MVDNKASSRLTKVPFDLPHLSHHWLWQLANCNKAGVTGKWREIRGVVKVRISSFELLVALGIPNLFDFSYTTLSLFLSCSSMKLLTTTPYAISILPQKISAVEEAYLYTRWPLTSRKNILIADPDDRLA